MAFFTRVGASTINRSSSSSQLNAGIRLLASDGLSRIERMLVCLLVVMRWRRFGVFSQTEQFVTRAVRGVFAGSLDEHPRRFTPRSDAQPFAGALDIFVDREGRQVERATDLLGMHVARNQPQALPLSRRQSRK